MEIREKIETMQTKALLKSIQILSEALKTREGFGVTDTTMKNYQLKLM